MRPPLWPSPWPAEDGGATRRQLAEIDLDVRGRTPSVTTRLTFADSSAMASTMTVLREPGEVYLLGHTGGDDAIAAVEQIDPVSLAAVRRVELPGGPTWPGGLAAHGDGTLHAVFGNHAHRLSAGLDVLASVELPRRRPYNSFVVLADGSLATKDFGGARPGHAGSDEPCELLVLDHESLSIRARLTLPEPSTARLSALDDMIIVVGHTRVWQVLWDGAQLTLDGVAAHYRTLDGQTYGWDAVIVDGAAWFLDDGEGSERFAGTFRGIGANQAPLHLVRADLRSGEIQMAEICGRPNGLIANPPAIDVDRKRAIGYDSGNGVVTAFELVADDAGCSTIGEMAWSRELNHAAHPMLLARSGQVLLGDFDIDRSMEQAVVLDVTTGDELARVDTGLPIQSVVFPSPGFDDDIYVCTFAGVARIAF
jgi:hypothetical protein